MKGTSPPAGFSCGDTPEEEEGEREAGNRSARTCISISIEEHPVISSGRDRWSRGLIPGGIPERVRTRIFRGRIAGRKYNIGIRRSMLRVVSARRSKKLPLVVPLKRAFNEPGKAEEFRRNGIVARAYVLKSVFEVQ